MSDIEVAAEIERLRADAARLRAQRYELADEIERLRQALKFVAELTGEELKYAKVGTGAEVALRHANRRAHEALADKKETG